jgi:LCP family protein required for cell wall assembly
MNKPAYAEQASTVGFGDEAHDAHIKDEPEAKKRRFHRSKTKKQKQHGHSWRKIALRTSLAMVLIVLIGAGFLFGKGYLKARQIFKGGGNAAALEENVDPTKLNGEGDGRINLLLLGKGGIGHEAPDLTDTILVASIDPIAKEAALLSIPRDLYVSVPKYGNMKINAAYATGKNSILNGKKIPDQANQAEKNGLETIEKTVENTMGIPIHYYVMVDFAAFRQAIDTVGGVTITAPEQLYDATVAWENNNNPVLAKKGLNIFNGKQALLYARSRHGSARGDFDRAERQRAIILALKDKVLSAGTYANPAKISSLISAFGDHVRTNLALNEVKRLYDIGKDITGSKVTSIGLADPPNNYVTTDSVNGLSVVVPRAGMGDFTEIQSYVRNTLRDGFLKSENANIIILNGTTRAGLATKKSDELKSYGYNVTLLDDAPTKDYEDTILVDMRNGAKKYTRSYLEKRLGVAATTRLPDSTINAGTADFVIILGRNEAN